jgi:hypothetical protein
MTLTKLYLRSRSAGLALALLATVMAGSWLWWRWDGGGPTLATGLLPMAGPLAAAVIVATGVRSPFGELEAAVGHRVRMLRLPHLAGLLILAGAGLSLVAMGWSLADAPWVLARNLMGLAGLSLLAARVLGAGLSWLPPLVYVVLCGGAIDERNVTEWAWPALGSGDVVAATLAVALLGAGLAAVTATGAPDG